MDGHPIRGAIMMVVLMILNAITEAMITAFENVSEANAEKRASEGERKAKLVAYLLRHHRRYITVTDFVCISCVAGMTISYFCGLFPALRTYFMTLLPERQAAAVLFSVAVTVLVVLFVELVSIKLPKKIAFQHAEGYAYATAGLLRFYTIVLAPFAWVTETITHGFLSLFHLKDSEQEEKVTEEELLSTVTEAQETGILEADEAEMIHNIFEFDQKEVNDIMTHRKNVIAVSADMSLEAAMNFMLEEPYSRFPVYEEVMENIVGILHLKDVMAMYMNSSPEELKLKRVKDAAREPYFVPDTQGLDVLFKDMQQKKIHMAIAIDEYGQTAGIITMEDILEEIVGDIQDEYDEEEEDIMPQADGSFLVRGTASLDELSEVTGIKIEEEDFDTLNGLLIAELDHIPEDGEYATIEYNGFRMDILETKNKMITLVRMKKLTESDDEGTSED
ncbi:MAG: hemolysin family protein [Lachnospiraceae bacterium]